MSSNAAELSSRLDRASTSNHTIHLEKMRKTLIQSLETLSEINDPAYADVIEKKRQEVTEALEKISSITDPNIGALRKLNQAIIRGDFAEVAKISLLKSLNDVPLVVVNLGVLELAVSTEHADINIVKFLLCLRDNSGEFLLKPNEDIKSKAKDEAIKGLISTVMSHDGNRAHIEQCPVLAASRP